MAQRLSLDERARVEVMITAGVSVAEAARRLERDPSTIHRELALNRDGAYDAEAAQAAAAARARRPKTPKLAADAALAATVGALLAHRMSPHAISALVAGEGASIAAETIYRACYDHSGRRGLPEGSWRLLPRRCRRRKPQGRHARKPSPLGVFRPICERPASVEDRSEAGHWEGDLIIGKPTTASAAVATLVERCQPPHPGGGAARRLRRSQHRRRCERRPQPASPRHLLQDPDLGHSYWWGLTG